MGWFKFLARLCILRLLLGEFDTSMCFFQIPVRVFALDRLRQLLASYSKKTWHRLALPGLDSKGISSGFGDFWCPSFPGFFLTSCVYSIANWSRQLTSSESDQILTYYSLLLLLHYHTLLFLNAPGIARNQSNLMHIESCNILAMQGG